MHSNKEQYKFARQLCVYILLKWSRCAREELLSVSEHLFPEQCWKLTLTLGPICLINPESLCKGKKRNISWKNSRFTSWYRTPNKTYNLSYIVYCQVSRLFSAEEPNSRVAYIFVFFILVNSSKVSPSSTAIYTTEQLPAKPLNSTKYRTTQIFN